MGEIHTPQAILHTALVMTLGLITYFEILKPFVVKRIARYQNQREARKAFSKAQAYHDGYGWAMAEARLGNMCSDDLLMYSMSHFSKRFGEFENGVERAIEDLVLLERGESMEVKS